MTRTTEAFSRVRIDALLADAGWNLTDGASVLFEHALPDGTRADYVLCDRAGRPMAVIEAKRASVEPIAAQDQGRHYAALLGVPFVFLSNGDEVWCLDREVDAHSRAIATFWSQGGPGAPDRGAGGPPRAGRHLHRPADRGPRLPDRLHRDAVRRGDPRPAQAAGGDGHRDRQDPHRGGVHQAPVRGRRGHPRPLPGGPDRARRAGRGRLHRPPPRLPLPRAASRPRLRPRQARHHRDLADHDRRVRPALVGLLRSGDHRRVPPLDLRPVERGAAALRRHPVGPDRDPVHRGGGAGGRRRDRPRGRALRARYAPLLRGRAADLPLHAPAGDRRGLPRPLPHLPGDDRQDRSRGRLRGASRRAGLERDGRGDAGGARGDVRRIRRHRRRPARTGAQVHDSRAQPRHRARAPQRAGETASRAATASGASRAGARPSSSR